MSGRGANRFNTKPYPVYRDDDHGVVRNRKMNSLTAKSDLSRKGKMVRHKRFSLKSVKPSA